MYIPNVQNAIIGALSLTGLFKRESFANARHGRPNG